MVFKCIAFLLSKLIVWSEIKWCVFYVSLIFHLFIYWCVVLSNPKNHSLLLCAIFLLFLYIFYGKKFKKWNEFNMKNIAPPKWVHHSRQIRISENILFQIKSNQEIPKNAFSACKSFLVSTKSFTAIFPDKWKFEWSRKFVEINSKSKEFAFNQILFEAFHVFLVNNIENEIELRIFIAD